MDLHLKRRKSKLIVLYMLYIMHLFPFTSHLRGMARAPHVKQEYDNAEDGKVYSNKSFS